jgi:hypothetical protein
LTCLKNDIAILMKFASDAGGRGVEDGHIGDGHGREISYG